MGTKEDIIKLRQQDRSTLRAIAERLGISRTQVYNVLHGAGIVGPRSYPELGNIAIFAKPDDVIAEELGVRLSRVETARRRLGLRKRRFHDLRARRERFAMDVFGKCPGPNFPDVALFVRDNVREAMADKVVGFYVEYREGAEGYARFLRSKAFDKMKQNVTPEVVQDLVNKGVLT